MHLLRTLVLPRRRRRGRRAAPPARRARVVIPDALLPDEHRSWSRTTG